MEALRHLLSPDQAAEILGLKTRHVLRLPIRRIRLGHRTIRYRVDDLLEFLDPGKIQREAG